MINKVGEFEKVSYEQFKKDMKLTFGEDNRFDEENICQMYDAIKLPKRATSGSCGYDFFTPIGFELHTEETILIPTGIRVKIDEGWWLGCFPKSGLGFKYRLQLDNCVGIIDSDYYYSSNEGHIMLKITCDAKTDKTINLSTGDKFMQGVFIPYGITYNDNTDGTRDGGFGSTGK